MRRLSIVAFTLIVVTSAWASEQKYAAKGMILKVDAERKTITVSCQPIPGFMEAMVMPIAVADAKSLKGLTPGTTISFSLVVDANASRAEDIQIQSYQGLEVDPLTARRLKLLNQAADPATRKPLDLGQPVRGIGVCRGEVDAAGIDAEN